MKATADDEDDENNLTFSLQILYDTKQFPKRENKLNKLTTNKSVRIKLRCTYETNRRTSAAVTRRRTLNILEF